MLKEPDESPHKIFGGYLKHLIDDTNKLMQKKRSESQMTLGTLIKALEDMPQDKDIQEMKNPHSYRGYYCDLAFNLGTGTKKIYEVLNECKSCMGKVFEGYKGGEFLMGENTPVWISSYGICSGIKIIGVGPDGIVTEKEEDR